MIHTPRNAEAVNVFEVMKNMQRKKLQQEVNRLMIFISSLGLAYALLMLTGCGTWEVKFGVSEYNGSSESRTYDANRKKQ